MSMPDSPSDTSVTFSLAELAKLEAERVREEDARRARAREREAKEKLSAEAARRAAEAAEMAATAEARARRLREEAEEKARVEARQRAEIEVARIGAEARARLDADNAQRAHELAVLKLRTEGGARRLQVALAAVIGLVVLGGGAAAYEVDQRVSRLTQDGERLREGQHALALERDQGKAAELAALDRRFVALRGRPLIKDADAPRATAEAARNRVDVNALDGDRLRAFGEALDALQARLDTLDRLALLSLRQIDLDTWAADRKRGEAMVAARAAGVRARALGTGEALHAYEAALDQARDALAQSSAGGGRQVVASAQTTTGKAATCRAGDAWCGADGKPVF
jgi:hypothetical protein